VPVGDVAATFHDEPAFGGPPRVPVPLTSFVGRDDDLEQAWALLGRSRLLSLVGPGGVGKSRLARELCARATARLAAEQVSFVELQAADPGEDLVEVVCAGLGLTAGRSGWAKLAELLSGRATVLVLDNGEHLVAQCRDLAVRLLETDPALRVVVTSREPLGVLGEQVMVLGPLALPGLVGPDPTAAELSRLRAAGSVRLLEDRARAVDPSFAVDASTAADVAEVCARLDGVPLAVELAAARLGTLDLPTLRDRLDDRFALLDRGNPTGDARHRSLEAVVEWSYEMCDAPVQSLWRQLAVFRGGCDLHAVETVCHVGAGPTDVLNAVHDLVSKSVLRREQDSTGARYTMLETIAAYGRRRAGTDELEVARARHADYYADLAARFGAECFGHRQAFWFSRAWTERMNLVAALRHRVAAHEDAGRPGLRMARDLWFHWFRTAAGEGFALTRAALEAADPGDAAGLVDRAWAWATLTVLGAMSGHDAGDSMERARQLADQAPPGTSGDALRVDVLNAEAIHRTLRNDIAGAAAAGRAACELAVATGVPRNRFAALAASTPGLEQSDPAATGSCEEIAREAQDAGDHHSESLAYYYLARGARIRGDLEASETHALRVLACTTAPTNLVVLPPALLLLAEAALRRRQAERAALLLGGALRLVEQTGADPTTLGVMVAGVRDRAAAALGLARLADAANRGRDLDTDALLTLAEAPGPPGVAAARPDAVAMLSRRERDVAELVAQGESNRDIAALLFLSPRTVEGHVAKVLGKLGLRRRSQVASRLTSRT